MSEAAASGLVEVLPVLSPDSGAPGRKLGRFGPGVSTPGRGSPELSPPNLPRPPPALLPREAPLAPTLVLGKGAPPRSQPHRGALPVLASASAGASAGFRSCRIGHLGGAAESHETELVHF